MPLQIYSPNAEVEKAKRSWVFDRPLPGSVPVYYHDELLTYGQLKTDADAGGDRYYVFVDETLDREIRSDALAFRPVVEWVEGHRLSGVFRLLSLELTSRASAGPRFAGEDTDVY